MMVAFAVLDIALHMAAAIATYFWIRQRLEDHLRKVEIELAVAVDNTPIVAPDPRVDELYRVVSSLRGAEALKQVFGKNN